MNEQRREMKHIMAQIMRGEEIRIPDGNMARWIGREVGRQQRRRVFIGRDNKNRITLAKLL